MVPKPARLMAMNWRLIDSQRDSIVFQNILLCPAAGAARRRFAVMTDHAAGSRATASSDTRPHDSRRPLDCAAHDRRVHDFSVVDDFVESFSVARDLSGPHISSQAHPLCCKARTSASERMGRECSIAREAAASLSSCTPVAMPSPSSR